MVPIKTAWRVFRKGEPGAGTGRIGPAFARLRRAGESDVWPWNSKWRNCMLGIGDSKAGLREPPAYSSALCKSGRGGGRGRRGRGGLGGGCDESGGGVDGGVVEVDFFHEADGELIVGEIDVL